MTATNEQQEWRPFTHGGVTYDLAHLNTYTTQFLGVGETSMSVAVAFSDHCFTCTPSRHDPALEYPRSSRRPGHFDFRRYSLSLDLRAHIELLMADKVHVVQGDNYAYLVAAVENGVPVDYAIVFNLRFSKRNKGQPPTFRLYINSAHPLDKPKLARGEIRFSKLADRVKLGKLTTFNTAKQYVIPSKTIKKKEAPEGTSPDLS